MFVYDIINCDLLIGVYMSTNDKLRNAKKEQNGEFYTRLEDIEKELCHYTQYFKGKTVLCNCDDPYESNFFYYFATRFNSLGLKKLICTCYDNSPIAYVQLSIFDGEDKTILRKDRHAYKIVITEVKDENDDGAIDITDVEYLLRNKENVLTQLEGNGDFRSQECVALLNEADIVVTNPPFFLFREHLALLVENNKEFILIGNTNALTYKEVFGLFKHDKIRTGYTNFNVGMYFYVPDDCKKYHKIENGRKLVRVSSSCWFTNLPVKKHREKLILSEFKGQEYYKKYFNYDAINLNTFNDIPDDYFEEMGVPVTFLDKYNPEQFELIGLGISNSGLEFGVQPYLPEHKEYRKNVQHKGAVDGDLYMLDENGHPDVPYARIIIKRRVANDN